MPKYELFRFCSLSVAVSEARMACRLIVTTANNHKGLKLMQQRNLFSTPYEHEEYSTKQAFKMSNFS